MPRSPHQREDPVMSDSYMMEVAVSEARDRLAEVIDETRRSGEPISVTRRGRRVAVIIDSNAFDRLVDIGDDIEDRRELDAARADDDYVPWDEVKAALGFERAGIRSKSPDERSSRSLDCRGRNSSGFELQLSCWLKSLDLPAASPSQERTPPTGRASATSGSCMKSSMPVW